MVSLFKNSNYYSRLAAVALTKPSKSYAVVYKVTDNKRIKTSVQRPLIRVEKTFALGKSIPKAKAKQSISQPHLI